MIIQSAQIASGSSRTYRQSQTKQESLSLWNNSTGASVSFFNSNTESIYVEEQQGEINRKNSDNGTEETALSSAMNDFVRKFQSTHSIKNDMLEEKVRNLDKIRRESVDYLIRILFDKDSRINPNRESSNSAIERLLSPTSDYQLEDPSQVSASVADGGQYSTFYSYHEDETTHFDSKGIVKTADGREISFDISLTMSRSFTQTAASYVDFGAPRLCDPLVINLEGSVPTLTDQKFFFDLDADGTHEYIPTLGSGSGYLSLDKNNDGKINNGSELFGTTSQNGFADLMAYDEDGNGWIDEADSIFDQLRIWTKDAHGNDILYTLKDSGVGALYLGSQDTEFSLKDAFNNTKGVIQKTGMFLYENGNVGTMSQLDLAT